MNRLSSLAGLCCLLVVSATAACAAPTDDDVSQESEAISIKLIEGTFGRTAEATPIMELYFAPPDASSKRVQFNLTVDLPGCKQGCDKAEVVGYATKWKGTATAGSFTLSAPGAAAEAAPFLGNYTFTRTNDVLRVTNVASSKTFALRLLEVPVKGAPTQIAGRWTADSRAPAGSFKSLQLAPGADPLHGNFLGTRAGAPDVAGTYEVGPANFMTGAAPFVLVPKPSQAEPTPLPSLNLWIGGVVREPDGTISDFQIIKGGVNTISGSFNYRRAAP
jgi:hypothetical protein